MFGRPNRGFLSLFQRAEARLISYKLPPYVPVFTGLGTVTGITIDLLRIGDRLKGTVTFTAGTTVASLATMSLPPGLSLPLSIPALIIAGYGGSTSDTYGFTFIAQPGALALNFGQIHAATFRTLQILNGSDLMTSGTTTSMQVDVQIAQWMSDL